MQHRKIEFFSSIQVKVILVTIITITTILGAFAFYDITQRRNAMLDDLRQSAKISVSRLAENLRIPVWNVDRKLVDDALAAEMLDKDLYAVVIHDSEEGKLLAGKRRNIQWETIEMESTKLASKKTADIYESQDIIYEDKKIGSIDLYFSTKFKDEALEASTTRVILTVLILDLIIFVVLLVVFRIFLIKPLMHLSDVAENVSRGQLNHNIEFGDRRDEIAYVAQAIERMQISLRIAMGRLTRTGQAAKNRQSNQ